MWLDCGAVRSKPRSNGIVFCDEHSLDRVTDYLVTFENGTLSGRYPTPFSTYQQLKSEAKVTESLSKPSRQQEEQQPS